MSTFTFNLNLDTRTRLKSGLLNIMVNLFDQKRKKSLIITIKKVDRQESGPHLRIGIRFELIDTENEFGEIVGETTD